MKLGKTIGSLLLLSTFGASHAQLSSPVGDGAIPMGTGAGHYGANSPFAPIEARADVLPWSILTNVTTKVEKNAVIPVYPSTITALDQKSQRVQGYMMPLDPGEKQKHFLFCSLDLCFLRSWWTRKHGGSQDKIASEVFHGGGGG